MILWAVLMVVLFVAMIAGMVYLITRIRKFTFMKKLAGGSKKKATLLSTAVITGAVAFFWLLWGFINAVIILLHLIVFWLVSEGIFALVRKKRGGEFQRYYAGVVAVLFTIGYLGAGWYQAHHVWEKIYTITTDKKVGNFRACPDLGFPYGNHLPRKRLCGAFKGNREAESRCPSGGRGFCGR